MSSIVVVPNPVLRKVARPVEKVDRKLLDIIDNMRRALLSAKNPEGVGLAAPQIGIPLRMFFSRPDLEKEPKLYINPRITRYSQRQQTPDSKKGVYEGCLSVPQHYAPLKRSMSVTVEYQALENRNGNWVLVDKQESLTGFPAHVVQHEVDHLNGILFVDHVLSQNSKLYLIEGKTWTEVSI